MQHEVSMSKTWEEKNTGSTKGEQHVDSASTFWGVGPYYEEDTEEGKTAKCSHY